MYFSCKYSTSTNAFIKLMFSAMCWVFLFSKSMCFAIPWKYIYLLFCFISPNEYCVEWKDRALAGLVMGRDTKPFLQFLAERESIFPLKLRFLSPPETGSLVNSSFLKYRSLPTIPRSFSSSLLLFAKTSLLFAPLSQCCFRVSNPGLINKLEGTNPFISRFLMFWEQAIE